MGTEPKKARVLVVDDDLQLCALIAKYLQKHGYTVATAPDALQAQEVLRQQKVDLVITDLMMPHMDGIRFAELLRALPEYQNLPIILITAYPSDELIDKGMRKGVALTLPKPLDMERLLTLIGFATS